MFKLYGIAPADFDKKLREQGGVCAICKKNTWGKLGPSIDHSHSTGKVRGILCNPCNAALGLLKEKYEIVFNMIKYIRKWKT